MASDQTAGMARTKLVVGDAGIDSGDVSALNPLPTTTFVNDPSLVSPADSVAATHAAAVITLAALGPGNSHLVDGLLVSYSAAPTGGGITVADGSNTILQADIIAAGPTVIPFRKQGTPNTAMTITLADGGSGIVGKVNLLGHRLQLSKQVPVNNNFQDPANSNFPVVF